MDWHETNGKTRLIVAMPPRRYFGGNDWQNARAIVRSLESFFPHIFLFDCDTYLFGSNAEFAAQMAAARRFQPTVGLALPNACYGLILDKRAAYRKKTLREWLTLPRPAMPNGNILTRELGVPLVMLWDHLITHAAQYLIGYGPLPRTKSRPGCLEKLREGLNCERYLHYVPDSGHIAVFERLGICKRGFLGRYVVPAHNVFLAGPATPPEALIADRVLFAGNLSSDKTIEAFPNDPVVKDVRDFVIAAKRKDWGKAAWHAYEEICSEMAAAGVAELSPDQSFFWSLGRELTTCDVLTAFRTTVFKALSTPVDFYGGFADPECVANLSRSGLFNAMGSVPFDELGGVYARYQFSVDVTHTPFIDGSNAKVLNCFAAGGFMFVDWKDDLRGKLGELAEEFMYRNAEELNSKMAALRARPRRRAEIVEAVRERISRGLNFDAFLSETIRQARNGDDGFRNGGRAAAAP